VAALTDRGTAMLDIGGGVRAVAEYGRLRVERLDAPKPEAQPAAVLAIPGSVAFGTHEVRCEVGAPAPEPGVIDRAALGSARELLVRSWRPGDRMAPLGLGGASKSLQDLFSARRVPRLERPRVPVVECGGEIVWVAGVATSERHKVTAVTREAVRLSCS
jgi:tRNA(Ile)-lysidine synthase